MVTTPYPEWAPPRWMHSHSTPVMAPSLRMPILSLMSVSGRPRWVMKVSSRLTMMRTQPPTLRAKSAAISSTLSVSVRQPKPPPTWGLTTRMRGDAVAHHVVVGDRGVHLHLVLAHLGAVVGAFADQVGRREGRFDVAELEQHVALEILRLAVVNSDCVGRHRLMRRVIGRQLAHFQLDAA